ncbi:protein kinase [Streptomyces sp. NPDC048172]|uniref:protein kinase domain-containing protein n=1 Tax=Streptomyces sp. NPDC048172 TaxID=3365505 RepID=UPI003710B0B0
MRGRRVNGRYELLELLGSGGMGEVWRARDAELDRDVAVKLLTPGRPTSRDTDKDAGTGKSAGGSGAETSEEELLGRFQREARAAAALDSPYIVAVHDHGTDGDTPYLVMTLVEGRTLHEELLASGRASLGDALGWTADVCRALATAHAAGVVHRDIKPANVMVARDGTAKVVDFGIAKFIESRATDPQLTQTGQMPFGSVLYMAPEQFRQEDLDGRTDLYALGCVLYELLVGRPPYTGSAAGVMFNHLNDTPLRPSRARTELSPAVDRLVLALMARDPDERPADADEALARVQALIDGTPEPEPEPKPVPAPKTEPEPEPEPKSGAVAKASADSSPYDPPPRRPLAPIVPPPPIPDQPRPNRSKALFGGALAGVVLLGGIGIAQMDDDPEPGPGPHPRPLPTSSTGSPAPPYNGYTIAVAYEEDATGTEVSGEQRARVVRAALKEGMKGQKGKKLPVRVLPVKTGYSGDAAQDVPEGTIAVVGAASDLDMSMSSNDPGREMASLDTCSSLRYSNDDYSTLAGARELGKQEGRYLKQVKGVKRVLVGAEDDMEIEEGEGTTAGLKESGLAYRQPSGDSDEIDKDMVAQDLRQKRTEAATLPTSSESWIGALKKEKRLAVVEPALGDLCDPAEERITGEDAARDLPEGSLRFRQYRDESQKPDCALMPKLCAAPAEVKPLLKHRGAAELYDATLVLAKHLPDALKNDPQIVEVRSALRADLEGSTTHGLLGRYEFRNHRAQDRPIWVDERRNGKWKELGTVQNLLGD